jgi:nicotinamide-nucleotide amidase
MINVRRDTLKSFGAVSREVVTEMALISLKLSGVDVAIAVTGYAGGSNDDIEETGTVWIAVKTIDREISASRFEFTGSRDLIRRKAAVAAMLLAETALTRPERLDSCVNWQYS